MMTSWYEFNTCIALMWSQMVQEVGRVLARRAGAGWNRTWSIFRDVEESIESQWGLGARGAPMVGGVKNK